MPEIPDDARPEQRLRLYEVADLDDEAFGQYTQERFTQLVTAAIADAAGLLNPLQRARLHDPARLPDLHDALIFAEGNQQVVVERMSYHRDPRTARSTRLLRQVRAAHHRVARQVAEQRRAEARRREAAEPLPTDLVTVTRSWLAHTLPDRFHQLLDEELAQTGLPARPPATDAFDTIEEGWADGHLPAERTQEVDHLLAKGPVAFRGAVADDARTQDQRNPALRHPLLQRRWAQALNELTELTVPVARASSSFALGPLPRDVYDMPEADAYKILNGRRFLCALWQRRGEHARLLHQYSTTVTHRRRSAPAHDPRRRAVEAATDRLVAEHPAAAMHILGGLIPHVDEEGRVELSREDRAALKRRLAAEARVTPIVPRPPETAPSAPRSSDVALPPAPPTHAALVGPAIR
ncbi:hypothetical protein ACFVP0_27740 [Streptomyces cinereoruber]|uniref:hypothetical protein n=1 Tax=Streptomyces cinereoruber TaxID=67260 RepID=UPI0036BDFCEE